MNVRDLRIERWDCRVERRDCHAERWDCHVERWDYHAERLDYRDLQGHCRTHIESHTRKITEKPNQSIIMNNNELNNITIIMFLM